jgi:hypothetical protein
VNWLVLTNLVLLLSGAVRDIQRAKSGIHMKTILALSCRFTCCVAADSGAG